MNKVWDVANIHQETLRAVVSNFRESGDRSENSNFFLFAPKDPFGELFSKIIFKTSSEFLFWQKLGKFETTFIAWQVKCDTQALLVISRIIFALSSQGRILTLFIPMLFARLCITFHLSRNESCCVVQNFESLICGFWDNFQPCLGDVISPDIMWVTIADK